MRCFCLMNVCMLNGTRGEWDTVTRPETSHHNVRKHLCEQRCWLLSIQYPILHVFECITKKKATGGLNVFFTNIFNKNIMKFLFPVLHMSFNIKSITALLAFLKIWNKTFVQSEMKYYYRVEMQKYFEVVKKTQHYIIKQSFLFVSRVIHEKASSLPTSVLMLRLLFF